MADVTKTTDIDAAEAERRLGRQLAFGLPPAVIGIAVVVGTVASAGPALLVLVAGALLGAIALLWASIRTLGGDAPLSRELEELAARTTSRRDLDERKRSVLRALKDLEHEHAIGKIDDADFAGLQRKYRDEAKGLLRELDLEVEPWREQAEALARKHLEKVGLADDADKDVERAADGEGDEAPAKAEPDARPACLKCQTKNDADAAFCKKCGAPLGASDAVPEASEDKEENDRA